MVTVEKFIENFKKGFDKEYLEDVFTNGNCFHFALILKGIYGGEITYDPHTSHFSIKIKGEYYDITGKIPEPFDEYKWKQMKSIDHEEYYSVLRDCVFKM